MFFSGEASAKTPEVLSDFGCFYGCSCQTRKERSRRRRDGIGIAARAKTVWFLIVRANSVTDDSFKGVR